MKFCVIEGQGRQYYLDIDNASNLLGVSRRTFFEYLKQVKVDPEERKRIGQKPYFAEEVVSRMWILNRRHERKSAKSVNGGQTGVAENIVIKKGGSVNKPIENINKSDSVEQNLAVQKKIAEILSRV